MKVTNGLRSYFCTALAVLLVSSCASNTPVEIQTPKEISSPEPITADIQEAKPQIHAHDPQPNIVDVVTSEESPLEPNDGHDEPSDLAPFEAEPEGPKPAEKSDSPVSSGKTEPQAAAIETPSEQDLVAIRDLCARIGNKLGSVSVKDCDAQPLIHDGLSTGGISLAYRDFEPVDGREPLGRVLVLGGIHGDEFSSVSVVFKWLQILDNTHSGLFHWRFCPSR